MNNSNQTLRFSRSSREAFGYQITFDRIDMNSQLIEWGLLALLFVAGVVAGYLIGSYVYAYT